MISPARSSFHRKAAAGALSVGAAARGAPPMPEDGPAASAYQQLLIALGEDLRQLQQIESVDRKIEAKRVMIDRYRPWIAGALDADVPAQDDIVSTMLVWAIDVADWPLALAIARHVLEHGIALPERYKRKPATLIAEEAAEAGLKSPPEIDFDTLGQFATLTAAEDMHDQVRAKIFKALGLAARARAEAFEADADSAVAGGKAALIDTAITYFRRALAKDAKCGVKKMIEALEREAKHLAAPAA